LGYNPYSDPAIYVRNINDPNPWVGSDVTHEGIHEVVSPTFASQTEIGNIIQDVITDYSSTLPPSKRNKINPKVMNEIVTNYISNIIHGDVEPLDIENPTLIEALKKNINPEIGQGYFKKYAGRAHQNINAMNQKRLDQMLGRASVDEEDVPGRPTQQSFINRLRNRFYKPATAAVNLGGGRTYTPAQLNRMNALGGYYSGPAREQRQNQQRANWMLNRALSGKGYNETRLQKLGGIKVSPITTGGGSLRSGPDVTISHGGRDYSAYSNTPAGRARAAETEGSFRKGGLAWRR